MRNITATAEEFTQDNITVDYVVTVKGSRYLDDHRVVVYCLKHKEGWQGRFHNFGDGQTYTPFLKTKAACKRWAMNEIKRMATEYV